MIAKELISDNIPPIKPDDSGLRALKWMEEFKVSHLPVVDGRNFLGLITDDDILDMEVPEQPVSTISDFFEKISINENKHYYDALKVISDEHLSVLPVVNNEGLYTGSISVNNIIEKLSTMAAVNEPGSVLILEVRPNDYSLSQIAQIVESNDARVLSVHIASNFEGNLDVTLKINRAEINGVIQTFQRYGYVIKSTFQVNNFYQEDLKNRFDSLMNYLKL